LVLGYKEINLVLADLFVNCQLISAELELRSMIESDLSHANISECRLSNFTSKNTPFIGTSFFKTSLKGVNFTESDINGILVSSEELKGLIVNPAQAVELSKLLGLIVK